MDIRKLQRAIVDGLEDVKAQNIVVFNTEHLSPLFERVIIASGTSNRQTKSLAASVRDAVKAVGLPSPRVEGEANGEWIIVDCGPAVVHVMQPTEVYKGKLIAYGLGNFVFMGMNTEERFRRGVVAFALTLQDTIDAGRQHGAFAPPPGKTPAGSSAQARLLHLSGRQPG